MENLSRQSTVRCIDRLLVHRIWIVMMVMMTIWVVRLVVFCICLWMRQVDHANALEVGEDIEIFYLDKDAMFLCPGPATSMGLVSIFFSTSLYRDPKSTHAHVCLKGVCVLAFPLRLLFYHSPS